MFLIWQLCRERANKTLLPWNTMLPQSLPFYYPSSVCVVKKALCISFRVNKPVQNTSLAPSFCFNTKDDFSNLSLPSELVCRHCSTHLCARTLNVKVSFGTLGWEKIDGTWLLGLCLKLRGCIDHAHTVCYLVEGTALLKWMGDKLCITPSSG